MADQREPRSAAGTLVLLLLLLPLLAVAGAFVVFFVVSLGSLFALARVHRHWRGVLAATALAMLLFVVAAMEAFDIGPSGIAGASAAADGLVTLHVGDCLDARLTGVTVAVDEPGGRVVWAAEAAGRPGPLVPGSTTLDVPIGFPSPRLTETVALRRALPAERLRVDVETDRWRVGFAFTPGDLTPGMVAVVGDQLVPAEDFRDLVRSFCF